MQYEWTPFFYALTILFFVTVIVAIWIVFDSSRNIRKRKLEAIEAATGKKREPIAFYQLFSALMAILYLGNQVIGFASFLPEFVIVTWSRLTILWMLAGVVVLPAYFLRVVFPKNPEPAGIDDTSGGHGDKDNREVSALDEIADPSPDPDTETGSKDTD
jgi:fatty acid desaturase